MTAWGFKATSSRPPVDLGGTLRHTSKPTLRSYDIRASGDRNVPIVRGAWQMWRKQRTKSERLHPFSVSNKSSSGCSLFFSKSDTMRWQLRLPAHSCDFESHTTSLTERGTLMEKLITRKEAAKLLGISIATLDAARNSGLISYVQYVQNGCVYFTDAGLQEYIAKCTHRAKLVEKNATYRKPRSAKV